MRSRQMRRRACWVRSSFDDLAGHDRHCLTTSLSNESRFTAGAGVTPAAASNVWSQALVPVSLTSATVTMGDAITTAVEMAHTTSAAAMAGRAQPAVTSHHG